MTGSKIPVQARPFVGKRLIASPLSSGSPTWGHEERMLFTIPINGEADEAQNDYGSFRIAVGCNACKLDRLRRRQPTGGLARIQELH